MMHTKNQQLGTWYFLTPYEIYDINNYNRCRYFFLIVCFLQKIFQLIYHISFSRCWWHSWTIKRVVVQRNVVFNCLMSYLISLTEAVLTELWIPSYWLFVVWCFLQLVLHRPFSFQQCDLQKVIWTGKSNHWVWSSSNFRCLIETSGSEITCEEIFFKILEDTSRRKGFPLSWMNCFSFWTATYIG